MNNLISKASVCEILADIYPTDGEKVVAVKEVDKAYEAIQQLPPAQPEIEERMSETEQNVPNDDFISRKGAIDAIEAVFPVDPMKSEYAQGIACGAALSKTYIEQLPSAQPEQRWIPCSERLPEQYGNYLVSYRTDDFESDIGTFDPDRINSDTGEWSACDANGFYWVASKGLEVIAWMPLPEPYREDIE